MKHENIRAMILAGLFAALTAAGAFVRIPLGMTAITLQTLFTALAGILLGPRWGMYAQGVYVLLGLIGLPVFTMGGGLGYLLQPSCGFLLGLIPAAGITGALAGEGRGRIALACLAGECALYLIGVPYMYLVLNLYLGRALPLGAVVQAGMLVYLPGDAVKIALAALIAPALRRALGGRRGA